MRIQHNISAMNSYRQMGTNNNALSKNLEKLSSGFRINRAGDDAAGLAISEKMRSQIKGLETAQKNANDGISLVQTAEGALTEVHSMLNRMTELATQSANGTYDDKVDRENLQKEVSALLDEIDRISESTNFNGINLLDGSLGGKVPEVKATFATAATPTEVVGSGAVYTSDAVTEVAVGQIGTYTLQYKDTNGETQDLNVTYDGTGDAGKDAAAIVEELKKNTDLASQFEFSSSDDGKITLTSKTHALSTDEGVASVTDFNGAAKDAPDTEGTYDGTTLDQAMVAGDMLVVDGKTYTIANVENNDPEKGLYKDEEGVIEQLKADGYKVVQKDSNADDADTLKDALIVKTGEAKDGLTLQIGDTADEFNQLTVKVGDMSSSALGISDINISTQEGAAAAVQKIKDAINTVSSTRGDLGAVQNRLEHTINNLGVTTENITAAESRIRDTDMASEMMAYTKNNILIQASQAMLAQANQVPQGVLQLLQ